MKAKEIIENAKRLIEEGIKWFEDENPKKYKYYNDLKYYYYYGKARDLLLKYAYEDELNENVQKAFFELIPLPDSFLHEQTTSLKDLFDTNPVVRIKAAKYLCRQPLKEYSHWCKNWLKRPEVTEILFKALDDPEPKVVADVFIALCANYGRYFKDSRIYPRVREFYHTTDKNLQVWFYYWIGEFENDECWQYIIPMLQQKQNQKLLHALLSNTTKQWKTTEVNIALQPVLINLLGQKLNDENKSAVFNSILSTLTNSETIAAFLQIVNLKNEKIVANELKKAIEMKCSREKTDYLIAELGL